MDESTRKLKFIKKKGTKSKYFLKRDLDEYLMGDSVIKEDEDDIEEIRVKMMEYRDLLSGERIEPSELYRAKDIKMLNEALDNHVKSMEAKLTKAKSDMERFRKELGL